MSLHFALGSGWKLDRLWRRRADARPAKFPLSDARAVDDRRIPRQDDPRLVRRLWLRRGSVAIALGAIFLAGVVTVVFASRGILDVARSRKELAQWSARVEEQRERVLELRREVQRLRRESVALERIAREQLGFVKPGEVTFLLPRTDTTVGAPRRTPPSSGSDRPRALSDPG